MLTRFWLTRVAARHPRTLAGLGAGVVAGAIPMPALAPWTHAILAWDIGALVLLGATIQLFVQEGSDTAIARHAKGQQEGEWVVFGVSLAAVAFSFGALALELPNAKTLPAGQQGLHIGLAAATLLLSWLVTHVVFTYRYAHEYYTTSEGRHAVDGGLQFPGDEPPDYWDFFYFGLVLGMTFQVSDVVITSRKFRRLATLHGFIGFLFNTVIVALTVNAAAGLLN